MSFVRYFWSALVLTGISTLLMYVMVDLLSIHYLLSFWTATIIVFFARYFFMERYVFKKKQKKNPNELEQLSFFEKYGLYILFALLLLAAFAAFFYFTPYKISSVQLNG